ncbi:MAG TPA: hypothetical protein VFO66_04610, partial [Gemmatimonadaceae bacterium]|nr:hypothetical protein [Gemmatimonadaceae bacterium]
MTPRKAAWIVMAGALLLGGASTASAQWNSTAIGVAEYDTEQTLLLLAGVSASPGGVGIAPLVGVQANFLTFDAVDRVEVFTVRPYAGLRSGFEGGSLYG